jgi:hypothetical protein
MRANSIFHRIMVKLGRYRLIPDRSTGADYMHRYYLFLKDRKWFPFNVTLHEILQSDEPVFHDHPWPYMTIILKGGYYEHTPVFDKSGKLLADVSKWRGPGSIICRKSKEYHWLELHNNEPTTSLFFMGPQLKDWGFWKGKWVTNTEYLKTK